LELTEEREQEEEKLRERRKEIDTSVQGLRY
jgi:hypothetical protein